METDTLLGFRRTRKRVNLCLVILCLILSILVAVFLPSFVYYYVKYRETQQGPPAWQQSGVSDQQLEKFEFDVAATDASVCSNMAAFVMNVLGGNAMDAVVSGIFCVGVSNFHSAGIGGGSFLMYYDSSSKNFSAFNYRETAPSSAKFDMFNSTFPNASVHGGLAIAVPGEVAGLAAAHARFGRLSWSSVVSPVSRLLRAGQRVSPALADAIRGEYSELPNVAPFKELKDWMVNPATGRIYEEGDLLKDEKLAATFDKIEKDPNSFYTGDLADTIVEEINAAGGNFTAEDLAEYAVSEPETLAVRLRNAGVTLTAMPPPASGCVLQYILKILDGFKTKPEAKDSLRSYSTFLHRMVEAFKFGYAKRSALGDPNFVDVAELVANLTSDEFAEETRAKIDDDTTHDVKYYGPSFDWNPDSGTAHLSLVDSEGNAAAVTSTINSHFGSWIRGASTGIVYNNEMDDFSVPDRFNFFNVPPSPSNFIAAGKRPFSSMTPAFLTDDNGRVSHVSGGAGGTRITTAVAYTLARMLYLNETVKESTDAFRIHHQLVPDFISVSSRDFPMPEEVKSELRKRNHEIKEESYISVIEAIARDTDGGWLASGDFRKPSRPDGM